MEGIRVDRLHHTIPCRRRSVGSRATAAALADLSTSVLSTAVLSTTELFAAAVPAAYVSSRELTRSARCSAMSEHIRRRPLALSRVRKVHTATDEILRAFRCM